MESITIEQFWDRLRASGLVDVQRLAQCQVQFSQMRGVGHGNTALLVEWLISESVITRAQAEQLLAMPSEIPAALSSPPASVPVASTESAPAPIPPTTPSLMVSSGSVPQPTPSDEEALKNLFAAGVTTSVPQAAVGSSPAGMPATRPNKKRNQVLVAISIATSLAALAIIFGATRRPHDGDDRPSIESTDPATASKTPLPRRPKTLDRPTRPSNNAPERPREPYETVVRDDGSTLWASPTRGVAPEIRYVRQGPQIVAMIRPAAMVATIEGQQLFEALRLAGSTVEAWIQEQTGLALDAIRRLDVVFYETPEGPPEIALVVYTVEPLGTDRLLAIWKDPAKSQFHGSSYYRKGERAYYVPAGKSGVFAVGNVPHIEGVIDMLDEPARWSAPMESLLKSSDDDRHVNVLFSPNYVRSARVAMYPGRLTPLHAVVSWLIGPSNDIQAGLFSAHLGDKVFTELRLYPSRDLKPSVAVQEFVERLGQAPRRLNGHLLGLSISRYSRPVLAAFPEMLRSLHQYARLDQDRPRGRQGVVRCYLPSGAMVHFVVATDLALLESAGTLAGPTGTSSSKPKTVWERLKQPVTLVFDRDNLIQGLATLSEEMNVKIEILGTDLQMEGITKNQSFGISMRNQPAEAILTKIMLAANPDKTVKGPTEPGLKLIFVVKEKYQGGEDVIWVTTRAGAASRGDEIPDTFKISP